MGFIVDTCIWIDVERGKLSPLDVSHYTGDEAIFLSPVTIAELTFGAEITGDQSIRQQRLAALSRLKKKPVLIIDDITGSIFGELSCTLKKQGRGSDFRIQDIWIASQAIQHNYKLLTRNARDFKDIPGLNCIVFESSK